VQPLEMSRSGLSSSPDPCLRPPHRMCEGTLTRGDGGNKTPCMIRSRASHTTCKCGIACRSGSLPSKPALVFHALLARTGLLRRQIAEIQGGEAPGAVPGRPSRSDFLDLFRAFYPGPPRQGSHHPFQDIFWNSAGSMFADDLLAALFDCPMCRTSAIRGRFIYFPVLKQGSRRGWRRQR